MQRDLREFSEVIELFKTGCGIHWNIISYINYISIKNK